MSYDPNNVGKYYYCRKRFTTSFISIGDKEGQSIPFSKRFWDGTNHLVSAGETTLQLGSYIAFLATEYRLFKDSGLSTAQTITELFYALETINRLDFKGETYSTIPNSNPPETYPPILNGYFVRHDIDATRFLQNNPEIALGYPPTDASVPTGYIPNSGQTTLVNQAGAGDPKPASRDHTLRIIWGLLLALKLLDDNLNLDQRKFMDGLSDLKEECRAIHSRIRNFLAANGNKIVTPEGNVPIGGKMRADMRALNRSAKNLHRNPRGFWFPNFWAGYLWTGWMNGRMSIEKQNISGNRYRVWERSWKYGYESFFLYYGKLVFNWPLGPWYRNRKKRERQLKSTTEFYLNIFPCKGNFKHTDTDYTPFGWAMPDKSERSIRDSYFGMHAIGNFNALDFLLMHNLYYLNHFQERGKFPENNGQDCSTDSNYIDHETMKAQVERVQHYNARQSLNDFLNCYLKTLDQGFKNYKAQRKDCKIAAKSAYNEGITQCNNLSGWRKLWGKTKCRLVYRKERFVCSFTSFRSKLHWAASSFRSCRSRVKKQRSYYNDKLQEMNKILSARLPS